MSAAEFVQRNLLSQAAIEKQDHVMASKGSQNPAVYTAIKRDLMTGRFAPGQRLDGATLATRHATSMTPVRMALSRLLGERLVEAQANDGYHAPTLSRKEIVDLYLITAFSLEQSVTSALASGHLGTELPADLDWNEPVATTERLFLAIATAPKNEELSALVRALNDRLHLIRSLEASLHIDGIQDLRELADLWAAKDPFAIKLAVQSYHRRRIEQADELVKLLYMPRAR